jgi:predicted lipoprotein with Yx(FWY)xxD motif
MSADRIFSSPAGKAARVSVPVATLALALAACGSSSGAKTTPAAAVAKPSSSAAAGGGVTLNTKTGALGTYLTDGTGKSLYAFNSDSATTSTCNGTCVAYWPPLTSASPATAGRGITASEIGTLTRSDGTKQVTY